ncbi:MAG: hypothetical protein U1F43_00785 [Myxococcota bacterium]
MHGAGATLLVVMRGQARTGATLHAADGATIVDLAADGARLALTPGPYRLRLGRDELGLWLVPGFELQVFVPDGDLARAAILMSRRLFRHDDPALRLAEVARQGLVARRSLVAPRAGRDLRRSDARAVRRAHHAARAAARPRAARRGGGAARADARADAARRRRARLRRRRQGAAGRRVRAAADAGRELAPGAARVGRRAGRHPGRLGLGAAGARRWSGGPWLLWQPIAAAAPLPADDDVREAETRVWRTLAHHYGVSARPEDAEWTTAADHDLTLEAVVRATGVPAEAVQRAARALAQRPTRPGDVDPERARRLQRGLARLAEPASGAASVVPWLVALLVGALAVGGVLLALPSSRPVVHDDATAIPEREVVGLPDTALEVVAPPDTELEVAALSDTEPEVVIEVGARDDAALEVGPSEDTQLSTVHFAADTHIADTPDADTPDAAPDADVRPPRCADVLPSAAAVKKEVATAYASMAAPAELLRRCGADRHDFRTPTGLVARLCKPAVEVSPTCGATCKRLVVDAIGEQTAELARRVDELCCRRLLDKLDACTSPCDRYPGIELCKKGDPQCPLETAHAWANCKERCISERNAVSAVKGCEPPW